MSRNKSTNEQTVVDYNQRNTVHTERVKLTFEYSPHNTTAAVAAAAGTVPPDNLNSYILNIYNTYIYFGGKTSSFSSFGYAQCSIVGIYRFGLFVVLICCDRVGLIE